MNGLKIVPMKECHLDALERLERICFSEPWSRAGLAEELKNPAAVFLVAEKEGETAGYAGMHCVCGECYVDNVAVFPQLRACGVGGALVDALIAQARREHAAFLTLEARPSNEAALALYRDRGFQQEGRRKSFYRNPREDALILTLRFDPQKVWTEGRPAKK